MKYIFVSISEVLNGQGISKKNVNLILFCLILIAIISFTAIKMKFLHRILILFYNTILGSSMAAIVIVREGRRWILFKYANKPL